MLTLSARSRRGSSASARTTERMNEGRTNGRHISALPGAGPGAATHAILRAVHYADWTDRVESPPTACLLMRHIYTGAPSPSVFRLRPRELTDPADLHHR